MALKSRVSTSKTSSKKKSKVEEEEEESLWQQTEDRGVQTADPKLFVEELKHTPEAKPVILHMMFAVFEYTRVEALGDDSKTHRTKLLKLILKMELKKAEALFKLYEIPFPEDPESLENDEEDMEEEEGEDAPGETEEKGAKKDLSPAPSSSTSSSKSVKKAISKVEEKSPSPLPLETPPISSSRRSSRSRRRTEFFGMVDNSWLVNRSRSRQSTPPPNTPSSSFRPPARSLTTVKKRPASTISRVSTPPPSLLSSSNAELERTRREAIKEFEEDDLPLSAFVTKTSARVSIKTRESSPIPKKRVRLSEPATIMQTPTNKRISLSRLKTPRKQQNDTVSMPSGMLKKAVNAISEPEEMEEALKAKKKKTSVRGRRSPVIKLETEEDTADETEASETEGEFEEPEKENEHEEEDVHRERNIRGILRRRPQTVKNDLEKARACRPTLSSFHTKKEKMEFVCEILDEASKEIESMNEVPQSFDETMQRRRATLFAIISKYRMKARKQNHDLRKEEREADAARIFESCLKELEEFKASHDVQETSSTTKRLQYILKKSKAHDLSIPEELLRRYAQSRSSAFVIDDIPEDFERVRRDIHARIEDSLKELETMKNLQELTEEESARRVHIMKRLDHFKRRSQKLGMEFENFDARLARVKRCPAWTVGSSVKSRKALQLNALSPEERQAAACESLEKLLDELEKVKAIEKPSTDDKSLKTHLLGQLKQRMKTLAKQNLEISSDLRRRIDLVKAMRSKKAQENVPQGTIHRSHRSQRSSKSVCEQKNANPLSSYRKVLQEIACLDNLNNLTAEQRLHRLNLVHRRRWWRKKVEKLNVELPSDIVELEATMTSRQKNKAEVIVSALSEKTKELEALRSRKDLSAEETLQKRRLSARVRDLKKQALKAACAQALDVSNISLNASQSSQGSSALDSTMNGDSTIETDQELLTEDEPEESEKLTERAAVEALEHNDKEPEEMDHSTWNRCF